MKRIMCMIVGIVCTGVIHEQSFCFDEVALNDMKSVAAGHIDLYATGDDSKEHHQVWLYTEADCNHIRWTLGKQSHSEPLSCGETTAFINVPPDVHYTVIEGCGKRIAAYLTIKKNMHLLIRARDLETKERCTHGEHSVISYDGDVESVESEKRISLITNL